METLSDFAKVGPSGRVTLIAKSNQPNVDGYDLTTKNEGWPFHAHPEVTPDIWALVETAIASNAVDIVAWTDPVTPSDRRESKRNLIAAAYENAAEIFKARYPRTEMDGWSEQVRALEAYDTNPSVPNILIDILAEENGVTRSQMAEDIRAARDRFVYAYAKLTGLRQRLESDLNAINLDASNAAVKIAAVDESQLSRLAQLLKQQAGL